MAPRPSMLSLCGVFPHSACTIALYVGLIPHRGRTLAPDAFKAIWRCRPTIHCLEDCCWSSGGMSRVCRCSECDRWPAEVRVLVMRIRLILGFSLRLWGAHRACCGSTQRDPLQAVAWAEERGRAQAPRSRFSDSEGSF